MGPRTGFPCRGRHGPVCPVFGAGDGVAWAAGYCGRVAAFTVTAAGAGGGSVGVDSPVSRVWRVDVCAAVSACPTPAPDLRGGVGGVSVEAVSLVLNWSRARGTAKLVLIGIANHYGDGGAWPSIGTLARYANATERTVQRAIEELVALGEVVVHVREGGTRETRADRRPNRYEITLRPQPVDNSSDGVTPASGRDGHGVTLVTTRGDAGVVHGVTLASPEPSIEPSGKGARASAAPSPTPVPVDKSAAGPRPLPRPDRCARHQDAGFVSEPCMACRDARMAWEAQQARRRAAEEAALRVRCRRHPHEPAVSCAACASEHKAGGHAGVLDLDCFLCRAGPAGPGVGVGDDRKELSGGW